MPISYDWNLCHWGLCKQSCAFFCVHIISWILCAFLLVLTRDLLEDKAIDDVTIDKFLLLYYVKKQIDSMLPWFCVISGMNISDTHGCTLWATFWFIPHFHIIYDLLVILNRGTATWHQLFKWFMMYSESNMSLQIILYTTKNCFPKHVILTSLFLDLIKYYIDNCLRKKNLVCIVESPLHWSVFYISLLMAWIIFSTPK